MREWMQLFGGRFGNLKIFGISTALKIFRFLDKEIST